MPPEIARWLDKGQTGVIRVRPVNYAAPQLASIDEVTAARVEDARTTINAIAAEYATVTGRAKPRVGSWTFRKDMAVLGSWFAYLRSETDQLQQVCDLGVASSYRPARSSPADVARMVLQAAHVRALLRWTVRARRTCRSASASCAPSSKAASTGTVHMNSYRPRVR